MVDNNCGVTKKTTTKTKQNSTFHEEHYINVHMNKQLI